MQSINWKDKKTIYAMVVALMILACGYFVYTYMWEPFTLEQQRLEGELKKAEAELSKINVQRGRVAKLEADLVAAENEFVRLKEMFPEDEKVPLRLQDLYAVLRSAGVQIQKFSPSGKTEKEFFVEHRYSVTVNSGYHMLGYLFAEIANFNYPTAINDLKISRYSGIKQEIEKAESHGWTPITISVSFNLTTYTSKKVAQ